MTTARLAALQSRILDGIKATDPTLTDAALAKAMGCDRTDVSRFRSGERKMDIEELAGLLAAGSDPKLVLGGLAAIGGARVELDEHRPAVDLRTAAINVVVASGNTAGGINQAMADGRVDRNEARRLLPGIRAGAAELNALETALERIANGQAA